MKPDDQSQLSEIRRALEALQVACGSKYAQAAKDALRAVLRAVPEVQRVAGSAGEVL